MARWKIINPHYLNTTDGSEWEYQETNRKTGKLMRTKFPVPRYIDPKDPSDWTTVWGSGDNRDGEVIVCMPGKGEANDITFTGDPTPDMIPLDDEAKAITASFEKRWSYKPEAMNGDYSQSLVDTFQQQMAEVQSKPAMVQVEGLSDLVAAIGKLVAEPASRRV